MKTVKTFLLIIMLSVTAQAQNMQAYMRDTRKMVMEGNYPEALKRTLWFYDHAVEKEPAISAVRNSFGVSEWKRLGDKYPPAMKALKDTRDKKTKLALSTGNSDAFSDAVSINRTLGEGKRSADLFKMIDAKHPDVARSCWYFAKDALFDAKEYASIKKYIGSPSEEFESIKRSYNNVQENLSKMPVTAQAMMTSQANNRFIQSTLKLIDYAVGIKDTKGAKYVQQQALKVVKSDLLQNALTN